MPRISSRTKRRFGSSLFLCIAALAGACDEPTPTAGRGAGGGRGGASGPSANAAAQVEEVEAVMAFKDDDFVESEYNRDPFRAFASAARGRSGAFAEPVSQRAVIMPNTAVEDMKLIAIISGVPRPKAMLVDPKRVGYVVERGDYIGAPKIVQAGGNVAMALNWRVDRIRDNEVVLTRHDPTDPSRPPLSRIIALRE